VKTNEAECPGMHRMSSKCHFRPGRSTVLWVHPFIYQHYGSSYWST